MDKETEVEEKSLSSFDKKHLEFKEVLKGIGLKPLRWTVHPRDRFYAVECLTCGGFWQMHNQPFHFAECTSAHKPHIKTDIQKLFRENGF